MPNSVIDRVNEHISDLFFNLDHSGAKITAPDGEFLGWDKDKMRAQARWFCEAIDYIGIMEAPSVDAILADFHARV